MGNIVSTTITVKTSKCELCSFEGVKKLFTLIDEQLSDDSYLYLRSKAYDISEGIDMKYIKSLIRYKKLLFRMLYNNDYISSRSQDIISRIQKLLNNN